MLGKSIVGFGTLSRAFFLRFPFGVMVVVAVVVVAVVVASSVFCHVVSCFLL
jgi:hypothetical protein